MSKIAFLYPGQGAQKCGMGHDFYKESEIAKAVYDEETEVTGMEVPSLCVEEDDLLNRNDYTQITLLTTCIAMTKEIMANGLMPDMTAGLSLGEYAAIYAAGGCSVKEAVAMIKTRGELMHSAVPDGSCGMAAVLGLDAETIKSVLEDNEQVFVANYNCPGQIVITGNNKAIEEATPAIKAAGAKRVIPLVVSGPFHSPYLKEAASKLRETLDETQWMKLQIPYVTNVTAEIVEDITKTPELLEKQVSSSVMWEQSMRNMIANGIDTFIEIGPGKTLSGFMRKIDKKAKMYRIETMEDMKKICEELKEINE
ncbi:MAG: ACP S-malonyltransferase [Lachnospiraceae bacterium]|nr:ACP S-malonyltransferase [Lachnospiraceae bacterium]